MPKIIGLTGGIGSGKTTVANYFKELGVPIYIADKEAKELMVRSKIIIRKLKELFGENAYIKGELNRAFLAKKIFSDKSLLNKMNAIVHPKVHKHFNRWVSKQEALYVISESALLFENNTTRKYDAIITVTAPEQLRITRVKERDNKTEKEVRAILDNQLDDTFKIAHSDYVITNTNLKSTQIQVNDIHQNLLKKYR